MSLPAPTLPAANDNIRERIAREIRHAVNGWRHGAAVDTFAAERAEVLAAWGDLRQRARDKGRGGGAQPRLPPDPRASRALMKQAASFRARPQVFERLLAERAGIDEGQIEELAEVHARAGRYLRSAVSKAAHAARQDAEHEETGLVEAHRRRHHRSLCRGGIDETGWSVGLAGLSSNADPGPGGKFV